MQCFVVETRNDYSPCKPVMSFEQLRCFGPNFLFVSKQIDLMRFSIVKIQKSFENLNSFCPYDLGEYPANRLLNLT